MSSESKRAAGAPKRLGVVGLGQCGGNLATIFAAHGYPAAALNVSLTDLATHAMSGDAKFLLGEDVASWGGPIAEAVRSLGSVDLVLAVGGLGGSVGGSLGELVRQLDGAGTSVVAMGVLPAKSDSFGAKRTALAAINDVLEGPFESLVLVDNQKLHALHSGLGVDRYLPACNGAVFNAIARLESIGDTPGCVPIRSFERRALQSALTGGGVAVFGEREIDGPLTHEALLQACVEILNNNPLLASEHELEDIVALGSVVIASEEVLERTPISVFDLYHAETHLVTGGITHDVGIYRGGKEKPRLQVIASGLGLPSSVQRMLDELGEDAKRVQAKRTSVRAKLKPLDLTSLPEIDGGVGPRSVRKPAAPPQHTLYTRPTPMRPPKPESSRVEGPQTERGAALAAATAPPSASTPATTPPSSVDGAALRQALLRHQALAQPLAPSAAARHVLPTPHLPPPADASTPSSRAATSAGPPASIPPPLPRTSSPTQASSTAGRSSLPPPLPASAAPSPSVPPPASSPPAGAASTSAAASDQAATDATSDAAERDAAQRDEGGDVARDRESAPDVTAVAADAVIDDLTDDEVDEVDALNDADDEALPLPPHDHESNAASDAGGPDVPAAQAAVANLGSAELAAAPLESTPISPSVEAMAPRSSDPPAAPATKSSAPRDAASSQDDADAAGPHEVLSTKAESTVTISESAAVDGRMRIVVELDPEDDMDVGAD